MIRGQDAPRRVELSVKKALEKRMQRYNKENHPNPNDVQYRPTGSNAVKLKSKQKPVQPVPAPAPSDPPAEYDGYCVQTKFGYKIQFATMPKPQKTPYEELTKKYKVYEARVKDAIKQQKIFRIISAYDVPTVRQELFKRGWVESVLHPWQNEYFKMTDAELMELAAPGNDYEMILMSRIVGDRHPSFVWLTANQLYHTYGKTPLLSKINIRHINFGAKDGLCRYTELLRMDPEKKKTLRINHPRVFNATEDTGLADFWKDFKVTAASSLILFLDDQPNVYDMFSKYTGTVNSELLDFAFKSVVRRMSELTGVVYREKEGKELEQEERDWDNLLLAHRRIIVEGQRFIVNSDDINALHDYICTIGILADKIRKHWAIRRHDGYRNIWLLKPTNSSQGQGIILSDDRRTIQKHLKSKVKFVLQKYIERPLLVYNTKFDIRQYFMITVDQTHVRCWTHPCCSVKLASSEFTLDNLNESIHITNAYVQQKYGFRSNPNLPSHHMWNLGTLILYIQAATGDGHMWNEKIYPTMVRTIQSLFIMSVENIDLKVGRFELFGCDWLITDDFKPYLLEVQRPPGMGIFSPVSKTVCGTILSDMVKVTVDYFIDKSSPTGEFEVIYEMPIAEVEAMKKNKVQIESAARAVNGASNNNATRNGSNTTSNTTNVKKSNALNVPNISTARNVFRP